MLRHLSFDHINEIVELLHDMHNESDYKGMTFNADYLALAIKNAMKSPDYLIIGSIEDKKIVGLLIARIEMFSFSMDDRQSQDMAVYVIPKKRGSLTAVRLLKEYISWAKVRGVKRICLGISTCINVEKTEKLYTGLGFTKFACNYKMEI